MNNTAIKTWYDACQEEVENSRGSVFLSNPKAVIKKTKNNNDCDLSNAPNKPKSGKKFGIF